MIKTILAAAVIGTTLAGPATAGTTIIVHGAFQDAKAWTAVADELRKSGEEVIGVDLPGRNGEGLDPHTLTLDSYRDAVLSAIGDRTGVVLVGHSFGGFTISAVAEAAPEKVTRLIYVAAYVPVSANRSSR